jgi:putative flippase GtrA
MHFRKLFFEDARLKFLLVGFLNTIAGFVIFTGLYFILKDQISYMLILLIMKKDVLGFA